MIKKISIEILAQVMDNDYIKPKRTITIRWLCLLPALEALTRAICHVLASLRSLYYKSPQNQRQELQELLNRVDNATYLATIFYV